MPAHALALAHAYRLNKQQDKALPLLEKAVAGDPKNFDLRMIYGTSLRDEKKYLASRAAARRKCSAASGSRCWRACECASPS